MNQFEAVCKLASDEWWCWDLNCTTCGNMHFTYAFKEMSLGKSPEDDDWLTRADVDHKKLFAKYGRPIGPPFYKVPLPKFIKEKLIKICSEARISNLAKNCSFPDYMAFMGWTLFGLKINSENYENLSNNWAEQLKGFIVRNRSREDTKIKKFLDDIINTDGKLLDHFDLGHIRSLIDLEKHPWVAVNSYYMRYEGQLKDDWIKHGKGKEISRDGHDVYEGEFQEGLRNGKGKRTCFLTNTKSNRRYIEYEYEGEWKDGEIWNGKKYDKVGNIVATFMNGEEKEESYI